VTETRTPLFGDQIYDSRVLSDAPLLRVLCQVRWPQLTGSAVKVAAIVAAIEESHSREFPVAEQRQEIQLVISPAGVPQPTPAGLLHRFSSADGAWALSVSDQFLTLETSDYVSSADFAARLGPILTTLEAHVPVTARIGYRYTNRIDAEEDVRNLPELVSPLLMGASVVQTGPSVSLLQSISEANFEIGDSQLVARWGWLVPGMSIDPSIPPSEHRAWLLDIDSFAEDRRPFSAEVILGRMEQLSEQAFQFFMSNVTPKYLERFRGAPV
jgi:uncharacterized protein (TIGR04255 family)